MDIIQEAKYYLSKQHQGEIISYTEDLISRLVDRLEAHEWISTKERLPTRFDNSDDYCQIDCLVIHKGEIKHLVWNCEHDCWDDDSGDDWYCDALDVDYWQSFPELPLPPVGDK